MLTASRNISNSNEIESDVKNIEIVCIDFIRGYKHYDVLVVVKIVELSVVKRNISDINLPFC